MERYDYLEAIKEDVLNYINENDIVVTSENRDEVEQDLNDTLFTCDRVTGNASGSYTFNTWTAEEYLCHNWDLLSEALTEFGCDMSYLGKGAELCDVTMLGRAIYEVLDEVETKLSCSTQKIYIESGKTYKISLGDECNNGVCYWSITGGIYEKRRNGRYYKYHDEYLYKNGYLEQYGSKENNN